MSLRTILNIALVSALLWAADSFGHGGGSEPKQEKVETPKAAISRRVPKQPEPMDEVQQQKIEKSGSLPSDVVQIQCKLGEYSICRGIGVAIVDFSGKEIVKSHTGTNGVAAFEGLDPHKVYIAKIVSEKYEGEVRLKSGGAWALFGQTR